MNTYRFVYSGAIDIEAASEDEAWDIYNGMSDEEKIENIGYEELDCWMEEQPDGMTTVIYN